MWDSFLKLFKKPAAATDDVNILLLGETGVGKSTLINSISNYFKYPSFKSAQKGKIDTLIPVSLGPTKDDNEIGVKMCLLPVKMDGKVFYLRLIDTPPIGDPRGIEQHNINLDNILAYLATLKKVHAICFVLKSNQTRFTKYCVKQTLARLDKSASPNIVFITTDSKTGENRAEECLVPLHGDILSKPPHTCIPLSNRNIFAFDNEAFSALLDIQDGKSYNQDELKGFARSWNISSKEIRRLLTYIIGDLKTPALEPHEVEATIGLDEIRLLVEPLATSIDKVSELIQENVRFLEKQTQLEGERASISRIIAKISYFLQEHELTPFGDAHSDYIEQLIKNENREVVAKLKKLLSQQHHVQKILEESAKEFQNEAASSDLTPQGIKNGITELYNLKHMGKRIQELKSEICRYKGSQEDFGYVVSSEIDLDKIIVEEEEYEKTDYSQRSGYDIDEPGDYDFGHKIFSNTSPFNGHGTHHQETRDQETNEDSDKESSPEDINLHRMQYRVEYSFKRDSHSNESYGSDHRDFRNSSTSDYDVKSGHSATSRHSKKFEGDDSDEDGSVKSNRAKNNSSPSRSRVKYSPRRHRYSSDSYDSDDRDFRKSSVSDHSVKSGHSSYENKSDIESYDSGSGHSSASFDSKSSTKEPKNQSRSRSYEAHDSDDVKSNRAKNNSSPSHSKVKYSSRRHRHSGDSYDSDDRDFRKSSVSDHSAKTEHSRYEDKSDIESYDSGSDQSSTSLDSKSSSKGSKNQRRSKPYEPHDSDDDGCVKSNRAKNNSSPPHSKVKYSSRHHRHSSDSYDSDDRDFRKSSLSESSYDSGSDHSSTSFDSKSSGKGSKNQRRSKSDDSDDHASIKSDHAPSNSSHSHSRRHSSESSDSSGHEDKSHDSDGDRSSRSFDTTGSESYDSNDTDSRKSSRRNYSEYYGSGGEHSAKQSRNHRGSKSNDNYDSYGDGSTESSRSDCSASGDETKYHGR